jgi:membrane protein
VNREAISRLMRQFLMRARQVPSEGARHAATTWRYLSFGATRAAFRNYRRQLWPAIVSLFSSEVFTLASAIATNALLSFFPFAILVISLVRHVFKLDAAYNVILALLRDYLPSDQDVITQSIAQMTDQFGAVHVLSALILIGGASGVFVPLELTLNRTWHAARSMSFVKNQLVSMFVVFLCGGLALLSFYVGALNVSLVRYLFGWLPYPGITDFLVWVMLKLVGFALSTSLFFSIYYFIPNIRLSLNKTIRASLFTGACWELGKYVYVWSLPYMDLGKIYGPFEAAVVLIIWSFLSAVIMIFGADMAHRGLLSITPFREAYSQWCAEERQRLAAPATSAIELNKETVS